MHFGIVKSIITSIFLKALLEFNSGLTPLNFLSTNPDNDAAEGQIWYNSTEGKFKSIVSATAWSSGAALSTARDSLGSFGIQTASVGVGGNTGSPVANTEEYNGSGWSNGTNYPAAYRWPEGTGTLTAGIVSGGGQPGSPGVFTTVTKYDGTSWTAANALPAGRNAGTMFGSQTSSVYALVTASRRHSKNGMTAVRPNAW